MIKDKLRLNIINIVFFSIIFLLIIVFGSGYFPILDECKFYELDGKFYLFRFIPMLIVGILSYIYSLVKKMEKPSHFYMGFTIVIFAIIGMIQMPLERYRIKLRPSIVTKAVVIDKPANYAGPYAEVVYYVKTHRFHSTISIGRKDYNQLQLNDTILLKYTADCEYLIDYYKLFPSKEELKIFQKDGYLKEGKILNFSH